MDNFNFIFLLNKYANEKKIGTYSGQVTRYFIRYYFSSTSTTVKASTNAEKVHTKDVLGIRFKAIRQQTQNQLLSKETEAVFVRFEFIVRPHISCTLHKNINKHRNKFTVAFATYYYQPEFLGRET